MNMFLRKYDLLKPYTVIFVISFFFIFPATAQENFRLKTYGGAARFQPTKSPYLGTQIGAGPNIFRFTEAGEVLTQKTGGITVTYTPYKSFKLFTNFERTKANGNQNFPTLDPLGSRLLIPGVGVGPSGSGFSLAGPNNQVTNGNYNTDYDYYKIMLGIKRPFQTQINNLEITPSFAIALQRSITKNSFSGDIPFFVRSFAYDSKTKINTFSPTLGLQTNYHFTPLVDIFGGLEYAYDINNGKAKDTLSFTGFTDQTAGITNDENTHYYALKAGANIKPQNFPLITLQTNYQKFANVPVINNRDGTNKSDISYEEAHSFGTTVGLTFKF